MRLSFLLNTEVHRILLRLLPRIGCMLLRIRSLTHCLHRQGNHNPASAHSRFQRASLVLEAQIRVFLLAPQIPTRRRSLRLQEGPKALGLSVISGQSQGFCKFFLWSHLKLELSSSFCFSAIQIFLQRVWMYRFFGYRRRSAR